MQRTLYHVQRDNDTLEPWLLETEWVFEVKLDWTQWLIGGSYGDGVATVCFGPLLIIYYRNPTK